MPNKPKKPIIGYGTNIKAGQKAAKKVAKTVTKNVAKAGRARGKAAANGTASKTYTATEMANRGTGTVQRVKTKNGQMIAFDASNPMVSKILKMSGYKLTGFANARSGQAGNKGKVSNGSRSTSLYERQAAAAYNRNKKK